MRSEVPVMKLVRWQTSGKSFSDEGGLISIDGWYYGGGTPSLEDLEYEGNKYYEFTSWEALIQTIHGFTNEMMVVGDCLWAKDYVGDPYKFSLVETSELVYEDEG